MIAENCITLLTCPICHKLKEGQPDDDGIVYGYCVTCNIILAWGHEQEIEKGTFKGKSSVET